MDVKAVLVVGNLDIGNGSQGPAPETFAGSPLAIHDVLGQTVLARTVQRLKKAGISQIATVCETTTAALMGAKAQREFSVSIADREPWRSAETAFDDLAAKGADVILLIRLGAYAEIDYEEFLQEHLEKHGRATMAVDARGVGLGIVAICPTRRNDASYLFRHNLEEFRTPCEKYVVRGYINRLITAGDLRQLSVDAMLQHNEIRPVGKEIRPGVWAGRSARIHPRARIVAPAYIGERAKVRASSVITRFTTIGHHSVVDCGTVVENASIAPYTYVGAGLDLNYAIAGFGRVANLRRNVEVSIQDPKLMSAIVASAPLRVVRDVAALTSYLPRQVVRGLFARAPRTVPSDLPAAVNAPPPALKETAKSSKNSSEFASDLVVARRYGNE